jgi:ribonucleoside-diphosphate reductase beta chain
MSVAMNATLKKQPIFDISAPNRSTRIIEGECSGVLNWNDIRLPQMYKLYRVLLGNHWIADEIPMNADVTQFAELSERERETFKKVIGLLAVLDSMQTMFVGDVMDYLTDSSLEAIAAIIGQQEVVHNQSYSYVLSSLVDDKEQNAIFEYWKHDEVLLRRNLFIRDAYQEFRDNPTPQTFYQAIVADMVLEGIFFYAGFAFFYNLARDQKMLATSQMISYIQRDEAQHAYFFGELYKQLVKDFPELNSPANKRFAYDFIDKAVLLETEWAEYVLGGIDGIDLDDFRQYIRFIANKRLRMMGLDPAYEGVENCMPWIRPFSDDALNDTKTDFFESKSRTYAKASDNSWDDL